MKERKELILGYYNDAAYVEKVKTHANKQLRHCTAWTFTDGTLTWLVSYATVVACYDYCTSKVYVFGRYSTTTSQHIRKFCDDFGGMSVENLHLVDNYGCYNNIYRDNTYYKKQHTR